LTSGIITLHFLHLVFETAKRKGCMSRQQHPGRFDY